MAPSGRRGGSRKRPTRCAPEAPSARAVKARRVDAESSSSPASRFPATVAFDDAFAGGFGAAVATPSDWNDAADRAAERTSHEVRLLGTAVVTVATPRASSARDLRDVLASLAAPTPASHRKVRRNYKGPAGVETWDERGEPGNAGTVIPLWRVYDAVDRGELLCEEAHAPRLLASLVASQHPATSPWSVPLMRCVCVLDAAEYREDHHHRAKTETETNAHARATTPSSGEDADATAAALPSSSSSARLTIAAYASRLTFELIACDELKFVLSHLAPSAPVRHPAVSPLPPDPPRCFAVDERAAGGHDDSGFAFTLPGLLAAAVSEGYPAEARTPAGVTKTMFDFQLQTLRWMRDREAAPRGLNGAFWEERRWADADACELRGASGSYWYFPLAGELRLDEPPTRRGGMLCEEMGLGKTLEVAALVVADRDDARRAANERSSRRDENVAAENVAAENVAAETSAETSPVGSVSSRATLVVLPPPLLRQWEAELRACVAPGLLRVVAYRGGRAANGTAPEALADADVVLCTYPQLQREATKAPKARGARSKGGEAKGSGGDTEGTSAVEGTTEPGITTHRRKDPAAAGSASALSRVFWRRVVLDECQMVRSSTTQLARACESLRSDFRWMVSGTPLHAGVDDLNGELAFLGVWPFCLSDQTDGFWAHRVSRPFAARDPDALALLHALLRGVTVRHTKAQRRVADGTALLALPPATRETREVVHDAATDPSERFVCGFLEHHAAAAARGAVETLGGAAAGAEANAARALAQTLLGLVRGATTSATLVRRRLRDVDRLLRAAATARGTRRDGTRTDGELTPGAGRGGFAVRGADGALNAEAVDEAAAADASRVRAMRPGAALVELMTPREANDRLESANDRSLSAAPGTQTAFQLRNANMRSFEADRQAWRGTSREYADAGGAELARKLAGVTESVHKALRAHADRAARMARGGVRGDAAFIEANRACRAAGEAARATLRRLEGAFPDDGGVAGDAPTAFSPCACENPTEPPIFTPPSTRNPGKREQAGVKREAAAGDAFAAGSSSAFPASPPLRSADDDGFCCDARRAHRALRAPENRAGRATLAARAANEAIAAASAEASASRAFASRLRWRLAVESITSGAAYAASLERDDGASTLEGGFEGGGRARGGGGVAFRRSLGVRFLRRALLRALLDARTREASRRLSAARDAARDADPATGRARRAIRDAPEKTRDEYDAAVAARRDAEKAADANAPVGWRRKREEDRGGGGTTGDAEIRADELEERATEGTTTRGFRHALEAVTSHASRLRRDLSALLPYARALSAAAREGASEPADVANFERYAVVRQSGFELVNEILAGRTPRCCICCAPAKAPCVTRCMHLACTRCMVTWFHAAPLHGGGGSPPCPLCRKPFAIEDLIRIVPEEEGTRAEEGGGDEKTEEAGANRPAGGRAGPATGAAPRFTPAASLASFARLPLPRGENPADYRDGRYPALSMDGGRFLAHVHRACARRSPKMAALVADVKAALAAPNASGKIVVFSQLRDALAHAADALTWEGIGCAVLGSAAAEKRGGNGGGGTGTTNPSAGRDDGPASNGAASNARASSSNAGASSFLPRPARDDASSAVERFRDDPGCHCLLLHAGTAAAGLTLTHADLVILLEPFLSPGDEAQAANRAHRIGQTRPVRCVTYFVRGSVEERLLAFRARQREFGGDEGDRSVGATRGGGEDSGVEESRACELGVIREGGADAFVGGTSRATRERVRFVFGIDDGDGATEAEAGVAEDDANGDADDEIADAGADAAEST